MNSMDLIYRKTAATGASGFGYLIALYDTLAGDLRRSAAAQRAGNLGQRTEETKHALAVLAFLENWVDKESGELARKLTQFYARLRRKMLEAQGNQSAELFEALMGEVIGIRELWQRIEEQGAYMEQRVQPPITTQLQASGFSAEAENRHLSWSA